MSEAKLDLLLSKMEGLERELARMSERQRVQQELIDELTPIAKLAMRVGADKLGALESRGYFAFGAAALEVLDRVVTGFTPRDVELFGDNVVRILSVVRRMTQPAMLAIAEEAGAAFEGAGEAEPLGWRGLLKASHDPEVQRGMATAVAVLRRLGRLSAEVAAGGDARAEKLAKLLGPSRSRPSGAPAPRLSLSPQLAPTTPRAPRVSAAPPPSVAPPAPTPEWLEGWTRELAERRAEEAGLTLDEARWKVVERARGDYLEAKKSPNVRRLAAVAGVEVRELYALFPGAPGKKVAWIAGIPKPVGCI